MRRVLLFPLFIIVIIAWLPIELFNNMRRALHYTYLWLRIEWASFIRLSK